ncbi:MAG: hypothetical protein LUC41_07705 [Clostridiales bacterium]|nr:hypothetical protein [Clostridiales bacterium]
MEYAILGNKNKYTIFKYNHHMIRFKSPYSLEYYTEVKEWDHGYIVVMAKYQHNEELEEEYIDLVPILDDLYFDVDSFLSQIKEVKVQYD